VAFASKGAHSPVRRARTPLRYPAGLALRVGKASGARGAGPRPRGRSPAM